MFITFEGLDGSGKTTAIDILKKHIEKHYENHNFVFTREPGGTGIREAEHIRNFVLSPEFEIDPMSEALLYLVSRKMHITKIINPALMDNKIVICDRFIDSSLAYQGGGRDLGIKKIAELNSIVTNSMKPDFTFFLRISPEVAIKRLNKQNKNLDRLENGGLEFYKKVFDGYEKVIKNDLKRFFIIDGTLSIEKVGNIIIDKFNKIFNNKLTSK